jgi:hypothetical protein
MRRFIFVSLFALILLSAAGTNLAAAERYCLQEAYWGYRATATSHPTASAWRPVQWPIVVSIRGTRTATESRATEGFRHSREPSSQP